MKVADLEELFRQHNLQRLIPHLPALARPSIRLLETEDVVSVGLSRLGGLPEAPAGFVWPRVRDCSPEYLGEGADPDAPLAFLGQLNWAQLKPFDVENVLPASGGALFFAGFGVWCYFAASVDSFAAPVAAPTDLASVLPELLLAPQFEWTLPAYGSHGTIGGGDIRNCFADVFAPETEFLELSRDEQDAYDKVRESLSQPERRHIHRVLGHPNYEQNPMVLDLERQARGLKLDYETYSTLCEPDAPLTVELKQQAVESNWQLAFQVACFCDDDELWGDGGTYYFWNRACELQLPQPRFIGDGQCG